VSVNRAGGRELWIALGLSLAPAVSNGIGRFAYGLILPPMRSDLGWSYTQAGWVNTANALGYLLGAMLMTRLVPRLGPHRLFTAGMIATAVTVLASGLARDYASLLLLRVGAGIGGAFAFIAGGALVAELFAPHPQRAAAGIALYFGGGGFGIFLSGVSLPWLFAALGPRRWDAAWIGLGVLSAAMCVPSLLAAACIPGLPVAPRSVRWRKRPLAASLLAYFLFAVGSIVYMTFVIAWMRDRGAGAGEVAAMWGLLGVAISFSPLAWRAALTRWRGGWPLAASMAACAAGAAIPLWSAAPPAMAASAILFGGAFFIPPAAVTEIARRSVPREALGSALATYTVFFGAGQPLGPLLAGLIADATGTLFSGLLAAVGIMLLSAALAALQRDAAATL
jgi:predicted MFS family arabinose efflux permease